MLCTRDSMSQAFKKSQGGLRPATIKCLFQNIKREGLIGRIFLFFSIPCIFTDLISSLIHTFDTLLYICILFPSYHMSLFLHLSTYFFTQIPSYLFILYDSFSVALLQALSFPPSLLSSLPLSASKCNFNQVICIQEGLKLAIEKILLLSHFQRYSTPLCERCLLLLHFDLLIGGGLCVCERVCAPIKIQP